MDRKLLSYIESKSMKWAKTTIEKEASRLRAHGALIDLGPKRAYEELKRQGLKPYTIKTTMISLGEFELYVYKTITFKEFMASHANLFKYVYQSKRIEMSFLEAQERIEKIKNDQVRMAARQLLEAGLRSCELFTLTNERVIGKGGRPREVHLPADLKTFRYKGKYFKLFYELKKVGLTPHLLRAICATAFGRQPGVMEVDMREEFGWSDYKTATRYMQPMTSERRGELMKKANGR